MEFFNNITSNKSDSEYIYSGKWETEQDIVYIHLRNENSKERINMILSTSLGEQSRMIGILSGLSPAATPTAVKIACFKSQSLLESIDIEKLAEIFEQQNRIWKNNVLICEEKEIMCFFSNAIIRKNKQS